MHEGAVPWEWAWAVFTVIAAAAQTVRNAAQRQLTGTLGTVGATHVRFLFGFPFALLFLAVVAALGGPLPRPPAEFWPWVVAGALTQIVATALMLAAMGERSFLAVIAYTKTEPVQVALFGLLVLGDRVTAPMAAAILIATVGVVLMSVKPGKSSGKSGEGFGGARPMLLGLSAAAFFALSAVGFRGAILALDAPWLTAATLTLALGLCFQAAVLSLFLAIRDRAVLLAIVRAWRGSLLAGFMGAFASQFWFLAFALTSAANVRTLALIEVLFAQGVTRFAFRQRTAPREFLGIALIVAGVVLLLWSH